MPNNDTDSVQARLRDKKQELHHLDEDDHAGQNVVLREIIEIQEQLI